MMRNNQPNNQMNFQQDLQHLKANPMQMLIQSRLNVPQNMMNDPNAIIEHLLKTGQVNQSQVNRAYQMMQSFGLK